MKPLSENTALLRMAIKEVMDRATHPMTSIEIAGTVDIASMGFDASRVSQELMAMYTMTKQKWPLKRVPSAGPGQVKWSYYNPEVVTMSFPPKPAPVNTVNPPANPVLPADFQFNPVEFEPATSYEKFPVYGAAPPAETPTETPAEPAAVSLPTGVKCIVLTVAGVQIRIEMQP